VRVLTHTSRMLMVSTQHHAAVSQKQQARLHEHYAYWLLETLEASNQRITFFVTGRFFEAFPDVVIAMREAGHEIGYHGHSHRRIEDVATLHEELDASKEFIQEFRPKGFRAPWVFLPSSLLAVLGDSEFLYDSSSLAPPGVIEQRENLWLFPVSTCRYGSDVDIAFNQTVTLSTLSKEIPFGSGVVCSYLRRVYPAILRSYASKKRPCVFYLHLWQLFCDETVDYRGIRRIHRLPLDNWLKHVVEDFGFGRLIDRCGHPRQNEDKHYMTFDIEL
jgi:hypothetical protein